MLSLDLLDKVAKRLDCHSTTILLLDFFDKDQTSLNITRLHSTPLDSLNKVAKRLDFFLDFLSSKKSSEKSSRLARALKSFSRKFLSCIFDILLILVRENSRSLLCYNLGIGIK